MSDRSDSEPAVPIVCTLGGADQARRFEEWRALARTARVGHSELPDGAESRYRRSAEIEAELRRLVALEAACCAFLAFDLESTEEELRLTVIGPASALPLIREGWAAD
jgi:hypothetical protein